MNLSLVIGGVLVLVFLIVLIVGLFLSAKHAVTRSIYLKQKAGTVFTVLGNSVELPGWMSMLTKVEHLPEREGKSIARYTLKWGGGRLIVTELERTAPARLVVRMAREKGSLLGIWTYEIANESEGCRVTLTENGELRNPFFRVLARMHGLAASITQTLVDLAKKFGESADVQKGP